MGGLYASEFELYTHFSREFQDVSESSDPSPEAVEAREPPRRADEAV